MSSEMVAASSHIPGSRGMWAGILAEMTEFGLLFAVYFVARFYNPEAFQSGPEQLNTFAGTTNTVLMITGSYAVAKAVNAVRRAQQTIALRWLGLVMLTIIGYGMTKSYEIGWNSAQEIHGRSGIFFTVYYYLTFTHMVHVFWGGIGLLWVMLRTWSGYYTAAQHDGLEAFASYWHATDLVWLVIFPLVYLLR